MPSWSVQLNSRQSLRHEKVKKKNDEKDLLKQNKILKGQFMVASKSILLSAIALFGVVFAFGLDADLKVEDRKASVVYT